jgi:hypothetical protein
MKNRVAWGLVAVVAGLLLWVSVTLVRNAQEQGRMATCAAGMRKARTAFAAFQKQHGGRFPQRLEELLSRAK